MATPRSRRPRNLPSLDLSEVKRVGCPDLSDREKFKDLYEWKNALGYGRTSLVRRATRRLDGEEVALKCSIEQADGVLASTVKSEFGIMKALAHQNVLTVFDMHVMPQTIWISLEFCRDGCLESYLKKHSPYTESSANALSQQLLCGLAYLHSLRIVHRDIKPANLLLKDQGETLKIGDFGSAKEIGNRDRASAMLSDRGSSLYSAPELRLQLEWNERVDVWSAGLCMIFMTQAALPPFVSNADTKSWFKCGQTPDLQLDDNLSCAWQLLLTECLKLDPKERPPALQLLQHQVLRARCKKVDRKKFCSEAPKEAGASAEWKESRCGWTSFREVSERNSARHVARVPVQERSTRAQAREAVARACMHWAQQHERKPESRSTVSQAHSRSELLLCRRFTTAGLLHDFD